MVYFFEFLTPQFWRAVIFSFLICFQWFLMLHLHQEEGFKFFLPIKNNGKILKRRCLKWVHMTHLNIQNTSYGQKKGHESNWQFDSRPLKVKNRLNFLACRWHATCRWKTLDERYNFGLNLVSIGCLHTKLWGPKVARVPTLVISRLPFGSPGTKSHLDEGLVEGCRIYYKGEGGGIPQIQAVVSILSPSCLWLVLTPKVLQLCTNHFVFVLCRFVWVVQAFQSSLVPSRSSNTALYPSKVLRARARARLFILSLPVIWDSHLNLSRSWECIQRALPWTMFEFGKLWVLKCTMTGLSIPIIYFCFDFVGKGKKTRNCL
jgi:hypothetical protein